MPLPDQHPGAGRVYAAQLVLTAARQYLSAAGWKQSGCWWTDPHPELRGVASNNQRMFEAMRTQLHRDYTLREPPHGGDQTAPAFEH